MKPKESLTAEETLNIITNQWANTEDIMQLGMVGKSRASEIKKEITDKLEKNGYMLPRGYIPMDKLVDYLKINISYLKKMSGKEGKK